MAAATSGLWSVPAPATDAAASSEIMTIAILFQQSHYCTFKAFYTEHLQQHLRGEFSHLLSYTRFVELLLTVLVPLIVYLHTQLGACIGISFIDSTLLASARIRASTDTASSRWMPGAARPRSPGSTVSSCIWPSTTAENSRPSAWRRAT